MTTTHVEVGSLPERAAQLRRIRLLVAEAGALQLALCARTPVDLLVATARLRDIYEFQMREESP